MAESEVGGVPATDRPRGLVVLHGAALTLIGLLTGLAAVAEELAGTQPQRWRAAHGVLLLAGVWLLAVAALLPILRLRARERTWLCGSLIVAAYAFAVAVLVQAATGVRTLGPGSTASAWLVYGANIVTVGASLVAASLTVLGAVAALRDGR